MDLDGLLNKTVTVSWKITENRIERILVYTGILRLKPGKQYMYEVVNGDKVIFGFSYNDWVRRVIKIDNNSN